MISEEVKQILLKYQKSENQINDCLQQTEIEIEDKINKCGLSSKQSLTLEEAQKRNKDLLKNLETVKGNLRSKAIYSPSELQWDFVCKQYQTSPSLPITSWRCHVSVFV